MNESAAGISALIDGVLKILDRLIKPNNFYEIKIQKRDVEYAIGEHLVMAENWSKELVVYGSSRKNTEKAFFDLDLTFTPRKWNLSSKSTQKVKASEISESKSNYVILGDPGSGKTTVLKYFCQRLLDPQNAHKQVTSFPIVIRLKDLNDDETIVDRLQSILGFQVYIKNYSKKEYYTSVKGQEIPEIIPDNFNEIEEHKKDIRLSHSQILELIDKKEKQREALIDNRIQAFNLLRKNIVSTIDTFNATILLDGLDELPPNKFKRVLEEFRYLTVGTFNTVFFLTCRSGSFDFTIDNCNIIEICNLDNTQINTFINKWIQDKEQAKNLIEKVNDLPYIDAASRPLTLALLCAIWEHSQDLPEKPKSVYRKVVHLLLEEWDRQRSIKRITKYAGFDVYRKFDFLCNLSFYFTVHYEIKRFSNSIIESVYKKTCSNFDLPEQEYKDVTQEIESHTGLFVQSGYENFEFAHNSIQEYLCAEHITRLPKVPIILIRQANIPNELALSICISSNPTTYFAFVIFELLHKVQLTKEFAETFLNRLLLEKPDFTAEPILFVASLYLYNCYIENISSTNKIELKELNYESFNLNFKRLFQIKQVELSSKKFLSYYSELLNESNLPYKRYKWKKNLIDNVDFQLPSELLLFKDIEEVIKL